jgi:hypothetical protein
MFSVASRYRGIEIAKYETGPEMGETGVREVAYLRRRFLPSLSPVENESVMAEHTVTQGDRLDNITARYLGDPEQFWRVCDTNSAMNPQELTAEIGRRLRISLPQGGVI